MKIKVHQNIFLRTSETEDALADIWFVHGFGESGLSFQEAFSSSLAANYNLYVPDLPGFGVTPPNSSALSVQGAASVMCALIADISEHRPLVLVAHSMGSLIGTRIAESFSTRVKMYISIEGNLTKADAFFSGIATQYETVAEYHTEFKKRIFALLNEDGALHRYYASVRFADPQCLWLMGRSGAETTGATQGGDEFLQLACRKIYYWGEQSIAKETQDYIRRTNLPNKCFYGSGHWPMKDNKGGFYIAMLEDLEKVI